MFASFRLYLAVFFLHISALYYSSSERDLYNTSLKMMLLKNVLTVNEPLKDEPYPEHPGHEKAMQEFRQAIKDFKANPLRPANPVIAVTDSLYALRKHESIAVDLHFGIPGLGGLQYQRILLKIHAELVKEGIKPAALVLGCIVGNPLLNRYTVERIESEFYIVFDCARLLFPSVRIVLYGLPPVVDAYALMHTWYFERIMIWRVMRDVYKGNSAAFVSLKKFSSMFGLLPDAKLSGDTVHLSDRGFIRFEKKICDAVHGGGVIYA